MMPSPLDNLPRLAPIDPATAEAGAGPAVDGDGVVPRLSPLGTSAENFAGQPGARRKRQQHHRYQWRRRRSPGQAARLGGDHPAGCRPGRRDAGFRVGGGPFRPECVGDIARSRRRRQRQQRRSQSSPRRQHDCAPSERPAQPERRHSRGGCGGWDGSSGHRRATPRDTPAGGNRCEGLAHPDRKRPEPCAKLEAQQPGRRGGSNPVPAGRRRQALAGCSRNHDHRQPAGSSNDRNDRQFTGRE